MNFVVKVFLIICVCFTAILALHSHDCSRAFFCTQAKLENVVVNSIFTQAQNNNDIDWNEFSEDFSSQSERHQVLIFDDVGLSNDTVVRFSIDQSNQITKLFAVPGGRNGLLLVVVVQQNESLYIAEKNGDLRWLR